MIDRRIAAALGVAVLGGVVALTWFIVVSQQRPPSPGIVAPAADSQPPARDVGVPGAGVGTLHQLVVQDVADKRPRLTGVVLLPDDRPATGALVTLYRQRSAWPEWRREVLETARVGESGAFQIPIDRRPDLLVGFDHPDYVGSLVEVPVGQPSLVLRLERGCGVVGVVTNTTGQGMANVRVALEPLQPDGRLVHVTETDGGGVFRFKNVAAGAMRVVARHDWFQPVGRDLVVAGAQNTVEIRFELPALTLEGRVVALRTQEPIAGAEIVALPAAQLLGRNDAARATTRADGSFRLVGLARGKLDLEVRHPQYGIASRSAVVGPSSSSVLVEVPGRVRLRARLTGDLVPQVRGAPLVLTGLGAGREVAMATVDDAGVAEFADSMTPGWAALTFADGRAAFEQSGGSTFQVRLAEEQGGVQVIDLGVVAPAIVTGRVVAEDGSPIVGARITRTQVSLFARNIQQASSALLEIDLTKARQILAAGADPEVLLAFTSADGRFRIAGEAPGESTLRVARPGFGACALRVEVPAAGQTTAQGDVVMKKACRITGRVQRGGRPLAGAQVSVVANGMTVMAVSDVDGRYELVDLPPGEYAVRARYPTFRSVFAKQTDSLQPSQVAAVDVQFPPGRLVKGRITGSDGQPVEGTMVMIANEPGSRAFTDQNGAFTLDAPDRAIDLLYGEVGTLQSEKVPADKGDVQIVMATPPVATVTADVLTLPGKKALDGVLVRITLPGVEASPAHSIWIDSPGGRMRYPNFPAGTWRIAFCAEGHAPIVRDVEIQPGSEHSFGELLLEPGCEVRGVVVDENDAPIVGARVYVGDESDLDVFQPQLQTDAGGAFTVRGVTVASSRLVVRAPGFALAAVQLMLPHDVLGQKPVVVRLDRGASIEVHLDEEGAAGTIVLLRRGGRVVATSEVNEDGVAVFDNQGVGEYVVQRIGDDRRRQQFPVPRSGGKVSVHL